jgi:hypothetical protein
LNGKRGNWRKFAEIVKIFKKTETDISEFLARFFLRPQGEWRPMRFIWLIVNVYVKFFGGIR